MKTMLNIKIDKDLKESAQKVAKDIGLPLSAVMNNFLKDFVIQKRVVFADYPMPNKATRKILDRITSDIEEGKNLSPSFTNAEDALAWLDEK